MGRVFVCQQVKLRPVVRDAVREPISAGAFWRRCPADVGNTTQGRQGQPGAEEPNVRLRYSLIVVRLELIDELVPHHVRTNGVFLEVRYP